MNVCNRTSWVSGSSSARLQNVHPPLLGYGNHTGLFTEEISEAGEGLGNAVQGFTVWLFALCHGEFSN